jgi:hypothetical protein
MRQIFCCYPRLSLLKLKANMCKLTCAGYVAYPFHYREKIVVEKGIANYPIERWQREGKGKAIFDASFWDRYAT